MKIKRYKIIEKWKTFIINRSWRIMDVVKNLNKRSYYGRVKSRNLSEEKISFLKNYVISNKITQDIFLRKKLINEIGFGSGENILELSRKFKNKTFIGMNPI